MEMMQLNVTLGNVSALAFLKAFHTRSFRKNFANGQPMIDSSYGADKLAV